jgi:hypothetical protein
MPNWQCRDTAGISTWRRHPAMAAAGQAPLICSGSIDACAQVKRRWRLPVAHLRVSTGAVEWGPAWYGWTW